MMKNKFTIGIICIGIGLFLGTCTSNTIFKKPNDLISKDLMVDLLTEMYLASSGENTKNMSLKRKVNYFPIVFEKYNVDSTRFKASNYYYMSRIDDYDEILGKVEERLKKLSERYENERKIRDSIKRAQYDSIRDSKRKGIKPRPKIKEKYPK